MVPHRLTAIASLSACALLGCTGTLEGYVGDQGGGNGLTPPDAGGGMGGGSTAGNDAGSMTAEQRFTALCAACHGAEGQGTPLGPELRHPVADYSTWVVRNGRASETYPGPMVAFTDTLISDVQLEEVWAWLGSFDVPPTGQGLYEDYCANCHGADALGGRVGKHIEDKELADLQEKVRAGEGGNAFGNSALYMPHWGSAELSDTQLALIAEYIATL